MSQLLGQAHRLIGTPVGLQKADDLSLMMLQSAIDSWTAQLPTSWPYSINLTLRPAPALMNLFIIALEFTLQRSFLWPTSPIPSHLTFRLSEDRWVLLCQRAEQAVYWLNTPEGAFYLDVWSMVAYPALCCVIIRFKALEESKDQHHRWLLELADNAIQQWVSQMPNHSVRSGNAAMSALLRNVGVDDASAVISVRNFLSGMDNTPLPAPGPGPGPGPSQTEISSSELRDLPPTPGFPGFDYDISGLDATWFE